MALAVIAATAENAHYKLQNGKYWEGELSKDLAAIAKNLEVCRRNAKEL